MPRRILEGNVVSDKMDKTITVLVERRYMHPVYKKYIKATDKYTAHDETNRYKEGDRVSIVECRPISKKKRWTVITGDEAAPAPKKAEKPAKEKAAEKKEAPKAAEKKTDKKKAAAPQKETKKAKAPAKKAKAEKPAAKKTDKKEAAAKKPAAKKKTAAKKKDS